MADKEIIDSVDLSECNYAIFFIDKRSFLKKNNLNDVGKYWRFKYGSN